MNTPPRPIIPSATTPIGKLLRESARARSLPGSPGLPAIAIAAAAPVMPAPWAGLGADFHEGIKRELRAFCRDEAVTVPEYMACMMMLCEAFGMPCTGEDMHPR